MLRKIKILLSIPADDTSKDDLLNILIEEVQDFIVDYCNLGVYSIKMDSIAISMVLERHNKLGNEGISSVDYSGVSESFIDDYSVSTYRRLQAHRKLRSI